MTHPRVTRPAVLLNHQRTEHFHPPPNPVTAFENLFFTSIPNSLNHLHAL
jgi:hypothetical protein